MRRQNYYPGRYADQAIWLGTFGEKLPVHGPGLGIDPADVTAGVNDARFCNYALASWLASERAFSQFATESVDHLLDGEGDGVTPVTLPAFAAPAVPAGVTAVPPGALTRIFALVAKLKLASAYTEGIGDDLGVVGPAVVEKTAPKFNPAIEQGASGQVVRFTFYKYGHMGVHIEGRRGDGGAWEFLGIDTESPYLDERPLLVAGQPEVREYRMRFWDKGTPNGDWTAVQSVTVAP